MKFPKAISGLVAVVAVALTACDGGDSKSSPETTKATNPPATTVVADPTTTTAPAPPTTVEETTTTEAAPEFSYELVLACDTNECTGEVPADFPGDAQNPNNPGLTFNAFKALGANVDVCVHTSTGGLPGSTGEGVAIKSVSGGEPFPAIHVVDPSGAGFWLDAVVYGVSPAPNGVDWSAEQFVTEGGC